MKIGFCPYEKIFLNDRFFTMTNGPLGDDMLYPNKVLKEYAALNDCEVSTIDMDQLENFDAVVFIEVPSMSNKYFRTLLDRGFKSLYLLAFECPMIRPDNWEIERHQYFRKIFTWRDDLVDDKRYIKMNWVHRIPENLDFNLTEKTKFCAMITSHKTMTHSQELYSERIKAVRWFEQNHPEDFDLYGIGWDRFYFQKPFRRLNRLSFLTKLFNPGFSSYRGKVDRKRDVLKQYRFAICYENQKDVAGYITEKIFDCFFAGCVPIYWGPKNIDQHIPKETFIDRREFNSYEELYAFLKNTSDSDFEKYLKAIKGYLKSGRVEQFTAEYYAKTMIDNILEDVKADGN